MTSRPKRAASPLIEPKPSRLKPFKNRDGLGAYIKSPESFSATTVISHSPEFVVIHDLYPKSAVHLLILPRDPKKFFQHPFKAFEDADFLESHYNSFSTPFFVELDAFPLAEDDERRHPDREGYLKSDLKCWRCGQNYGSKFAQLKAHLEDEFEEWKRI
ncbi:hypothetical protein MGYG_07812 [Nannizzia gypsea CBS 118893]|uniref:Aprataxin C2HE/C2H2/C2HC zinc finger domain-containing protein n=1 Tax=Arthroderma gypseum (strain ATCC MYA-4604 / CBS 118893) TaxID=535722 RepID=E4V481_ARTGP|nr:hypothetical protein MGYG_07812 [Nannizzia gypsea CBS 118893]EFR04805.1 hypothetical protein MGYG_07812 [Nannizzia gypsea CBS 118893]